MAYVISEDCMACGTCAGECPNEAISEGDIYHIDPDKLLIAVLAHQFVQQKLSIVK